MTSEADSCRIPLNRLRRCPKQLRPVKEQTLDYIRLRDSIQAVGQMNSILVRPSKTHPGFWEVIDGSHRFEILLELGEEFAHCIIRDLTDEEVERIQIELHATRVETTTTEYARRLWLMANTGDQLSVQQIAKQIHQTVDWVKRMMGLVNLGREAAAALNAGTLSLAAAIEMAKLSVDDQTRLLPLHLTMPARDLKEMLQSQARHARQGKKDARIAQRAEVAERYRDFREVCRERLDPTVAASVIARAGAETKIEVWQACCDWVAHMDAESVEKARKKEERQREKELHLEKIRLQENQRKHS